MNLLKQIFKPQGIDCINLANGNILKVELRPNRGGRRVSMRLSRDFESLIINAPLFMAKSEVLKFIDSNRDWIEKHYQKQSPRILLEHGAIIPFLGMPTRLEILPPRSKFIYHKLDDYNDYDIEKAWQEYENNGKFFAQLYIPANEINFPIKAKSIIKKLAAQYADEYLAQFSPILAKQPIKITYRDTKSRWGSCNGRGEISLSWRLIFAPPMVFKEVVAHELAHLKEMNHSKAFYNELARLFPDYRQFAYWLKQNGRKLHLIG